MQNHLHVPNPRQLQDIASQMRSCPWVIHHEERKGAKITPLLKAGSLSSLAILIGKYPPLPGFI
jgi:hypothetical protein